MKVDTDQFMRDGYLLLRNVVPADELADMRLTAELMVDAAKCNSQAARQEGDPQGGDWYADVQPRVKIHEVITEETAHLVDFLLGENTLGVSAQLLSGPETAICSAEISCSGLIDYGYGDWHRDAATAEQAPTSGVQADMMANSIGYVQWNIALYDDDVFWFLPGSHKQRTTDLQRRELLADNRAALSGGVQMDLKPGDGVVYGFRSFGSDLFTTSHHFNWDADLEFTRLLSLPSREFYSRSVHLWAEERDRIEATLRALTLRDEAGFLAGLADLHPGRKHRMVAVILLCHIAAKITQIQTPELATMTAVERRFLIDGAPPAVYSEDMAARFTAEEAAALGECFAELHQRLDSEEARVEAHYTRLHAELKPEATAPPNFRSRSLRCFNSEMPEGFDVDEFIASWKE
jgi:hypothetical protein